MKNLLSILLFGLLVGQSPLLFGQAWEAGIGYTELLAEKGVALEDGSGLSVMFAEAPDAQGDYLPDVTDTEFTGKTITAASGASDVNNHSQFVAERFFGNDTSMTPGITDITGYDANDYLGRVLGLNAGTDPIATTAFDVGNHSFVVRTSQTTAAVAENVLERFDFVINRDNTVMVVGADNNNDTPRLFAPSYNAITVGQTNGVHSQTLTPNYGTPRYATSIVVPAGGATSFSTPIVASAAALLRDAGSGSNFEQNEVIRSTLFSGATKSEFTTWDRTATRPMDEVYGFGELNILNSYHIFEGGEFEGSTTDPGSNINLLGWDYGDFDGANNLHYDFTIDPNEYGEVSAVLSWNMDITDTDAGATFTALRSLADLNLELFDSSGSFLGILVDASNGTDYNNEHIYLQGLVAGDYTFRISGDIATDFGFSWMIVSAVPEPSGLAVLSLLAIGCVARRRRRA